MDKIVSQLDSERYFVGPTVAQESPMEPDVYLVPGGAADVPPPTVQEGKRYRLPLLDRPYLPGDWIEEDLPPPPELDHDQLAAAAWAQRDALLQYAALRMAPLQDAVDLQMATEQERADLTAWKQYRVALNRIDQQPSFPTAVAWPDPPGK